MTPVGPGVRGGRAAYGRVDLGLDFGGNDSREGFFLPGRAGPASGVAASRRASQRRSLISSSSRYSPRRRRYSTVWARTVSSSAGTTRRVRVLPWDLVVSSQLGPWPG